MHFELRHLRYAIGVADYGGFAKAAERLHVAQPALSRQIQDLELIVGARVFDRGAAGTTLTSAGEIFVEEARAILRAASAASENARSVARG